MKEFSQDEKYEIYFNYFATQLALKHNFEFVDTTKPFSKVGWDIPDKTFGNIDFHYLWKDIKIKTFEEFCLGGIYGLEDWYNKKFKK